MTTKHSDIQWRPTEPFKWVMRVHVSNGSINVHTFDIPRQMQEAQEVIDSITEMIARSFSGESVYLQLTNPSITYNIQHVAFIEHAFQGPEEWRERIRMSFKEPIGYKPKGK